MPLDSIPRISPAGIPPAARALYGTALRDRWQSCLARDLSAWLGTAVYPASVNQWLLEKRSIPPWLAPALVDLLDGVVPILHGRAIDLDGMIRSIDDEFVRFLPEGIARVAYGLPLDEGAPPGGALAEPPRITVSRIAVIAKFLHGREFGGRWQSALSADLEVVLGRSFYPATINQWLSGKRRIPVWAAPAMMGVMINARIGAVERQAQALRISYGIRGEIIRLLPPDIRSRGMPHTESDVPA